MLWLCFFTAALFIAGYALCSLYSGNAKIGFAGAMAIWLFSTSGLAIRPQMIGYVFLILELLALHLGRTRNPRWFFCLPPLFAIWVNCHGSFFLGLIVAAIFLAGSFFDIRAGLLVSSPWIPRRRWMLALALSLSVAGLLLNPDGIKQILYPLNTMLHQPPLPNALLIAASLAVAFWGFPSRQALSRQVELQSPVGAVTFINDHHLSGRMLNDYVYGGYLIWVVLPVICYMYILFYALSGSKPNSARVPAAGL